MSHRGVAVVTDTMAGRGLVEEPRRTAVAAIAAAGTDGPTSWVAIAILVNLGIAIFA